MKIITAKVLDPTHLELSQPIPAKEGDLIEISIPIDEDEQLWKAAAEQKDSGLAGMRPSQRILGEAGQGRLPIEAQRYPSARPALERGQNTSRAGLAFPV